jgi:hypothetical protein
VCLFCWQVILCNRSYTRLVRAIPSHDRRTPMGAWAVSGADDPAEDRRFTLI